MFFTDSGREPGSLHEKELHGRRSLGDGNVFPFGGDKRGLDSTRVVMTHRHINPFLEGSSK